MVTMDSLPHKARNKVDGTDAFCDQYIFTFSFLRGQLTSRPPNSRQWQLIQ